MHNKQLKIALNNIEIWLSEKMLYYSANHHKFYIGYYAGMGNFDVNELPSEYQGLIVNSEVEEDEASHYVLSQLSVINKERKEIKPYTTCLARVKSAKNYRHEHDASLMSAIRFASLHHAHQKRKSSDEPYLNHLIEVTQLIKFYEPTSDETTLIAAILHDIVEDTRVTIESLEFLFGSEVSKLVSELTCANSSNSDDKKAVLLEQISVGSDHAKLIKLADVISNVSSLPNYWSIEQRQKYVSWCKQVADVCASASPRLYKLFKSIVVNNHPQIRATKSKPSSISVFLPKMDKDTMSKPLGLETVRNRVNVVTNLRNQLTVILPSDVIADLDLAEGDEAEFCVGDTIVTFHKIQSSLKTQQDSILLIVTKWCRSDREALHWYNHEQIPAFKMTPREVVERGFYKELINYLESVALGGFA
jgi:antitoxin component of MazEF toxin-antitoxin module